MKIVWLGHSCFKITLDNSKVMVFDPFDPSCGYENFAIKADYVFISHDHRDHNCLEFITGDYTLLNKPDKFESKDIKVLGLNTFHDKIKGEKRGMNTVFKVSAGEINIVHLGDLGDIPSDDFYKKLGQVDILLIPVGGVYTIDEKQALSVIDKTVPNIIIPMHYLTDVSKIDVNPITGFLETIKGLYDFSKLGKNEFSISKKDLKKRTRVVIMDYS